MAAVQPVRVALVGCGAVARLQRLGVSPWVQGLGWVLDTCDAAAVVQSAYGALRSGELEAVEAVEAVEVPR